MDDISPRVGEQNVLPARLRAPMPYSLPSPRQHGHYPAQASGREEIGRRTIDDESDDQRGVLRILVRDKIESSERLRLCRRENVQLQAELSNDRRLHEYLSQELLSKCEEIDTVQRQSEAYRSKAEAYANELSQQEACRNEIADLRRLVLSRDRELACLRNDHADLQSAYETCAAEKRSAENLMAVLERVAHKKQHLTGRCLLNLLRSGDGSAVPVEDKSSRISESECPARIAAIATEQSLRRELDRIKSQCEALHCENQHLQQRNQDLIEAYWPIMMKLKAYEHNTHHE